MRNFHAEFIDFPTPFVLSYIRRRGSMTFGGKLLSPAPRCRTRRTPSPSTGSSASRRTTCSARTKAPGARRARGRTPRAAKPGTFQLCSAPYCWFWDLQGRWLSGSPLPYSRRYMLETASSIGIYQPSFVQTISCFCYSSRQLPHTSPAQRRRRACPACTLDASDTPGLVFAHAA